MTHVSLAVIFCCCCSLTLYLLLNSSQTDLENVYFICALHCPKCISYGRINPSVLPLLVRRNILSARFFCLFAADPAVQTFLEQLETSAVALEDYGMSVATVS